MKNWIKLISISLLMISSASLYADDDHDKARRLLESGEILALEDILKKVREIQPGRVLEVDLETKKGKTIYEIELLNSEGTVFELKFDAKTGQHLSTEKED
ncbi:MAG: PepSY domain-containing protein [Gammaproteobacteria bacterium]|nr:PepSY domain-containing protein [Gammaproteobacteria bacterium]MCW8986171.1 PepSY domain-containing protein [Gammaproteobacteria bacterium]MCW9031505.1 PepSY domain-containing protein [Gammaproteobacteria bacterium]